MIQQPISSTSSAESGLAPFLSVLVPAYEYPEGIQRILQALLPSEEAAVEILIHDDSASNRVEAVVLPWLERFPDRVRYRRNEPPEGAVKNWNGLLEAAHGQYLLLLHHDELPLTDGFALAIQAELQHFGWPRVLVLDLQLADRGNIHLRRHIPLWAKRIVLKRWPSYLLARNLVGAPSSWVVRREHCPAFDERLQWLVDVDWYTRILEEPRSVRTSSKVKVVSVQGEHRSITATLGPEIARLRKQEADCLIRSGRAGIVLRMLRDRTLRDRMTRGVEVVLWAVFRALTTPFLRLGPTGAARQSLESRMRIQPPPAQQRDMP